MRLLQGRILTSPSSMARVIPRILNTALEVSSENRRLATPKTVPDYWKDDAGNQVSGAGSKKARRFRDAPF
jgi:hypothetical protein